MNVTYNHASHTICYSIVITLQHHTEIWPDVAVQGITSCKIRANGRFFELLA